MTQDSTLLRGWEKAIQAGKGGVDNNKRKESLKNTKKLERAVGLIRGMSSRTPDTPAPVYLFHQKSANKRGRGD